MNSNTHFPQLLNLGRPMLSVLLCVFGFSFVSVVEAQTTPKPALNASLARMTGDRVRIRTGGSLNHHAFSYVSRGQSLVVVNEARGWSQILVPSWIPVYVHKNYIKTGAASTGIVTANRLAVRVVPGKKHEHIGVLPRGTHVRILGTTGEWLKISPPVGTATAWVSSKYIQKTRALSTNEVASVWSRLRGVAPQPITKVDPQTQAQNRRKADIPPRRTHNNINGIDRRNPINSQSQGQARLAANSQNSNGITIPSRLVSKRLAAIYEQLRLASLKNPKGTTHLEGPRLSFQRIIMTSEDLTEIRQARDGIKYIDHLKSRQSTVLSAMDILNRAKAEDERLRTLLKNIRISRFSLGGKDQKADAPIARGWIKSNGRYLGRQGTHSLYKGDRVRYYLRSQDKSINLDNYLGKRIAIRGVVLELEPKYGTDLIMVTGVEILANR